MNAWIEKRLHEIRYRGREIELKMSLAEHVATYPEKWVVPLPSWPPAHLQALQQANCGSQNMRALALGSVFGGAL